MINYSELIKELNTLPKGYISKKTIHGDEYFYLQYKENGKIKSKYIPKNSIEEYKKKLSRRKEIETILDQKHKAVAVLNKNSINITGFIMMGDEKVASFDNGRLEWSNSKAPLAVLATNRIEPFLKMRSIDTSRTNSRLLKKVLRIKKIDDEKIALYAYAATLTDNYWFKPKGSRLHYKDISFDNDIYADLALKGEILYFPKYSKLTPEITLTGSYEKCWKKINDKWFMYKAGTENEIYSEIIASKIAALLGIKSATYEIEDKYIKTENFADKYNFEPMASIAGDDDSYDNVFKTLLPYDKSILDDYLKLMVFDLIINNVDRHNENMGLMRDRKSGKIISLAPNFDNNLSLFSRSNILNMDPQKDGFIKLFISFIRKNKLAKDKLKTISLPQIKEESIRSIVNEYNLNIDKDILVDYIFRRYRYMMDYISNL